MAGGKPTLVLICGGIRGENIRLQPWRYLFEVARQLSHRGWDAVILTNRFAEAAEEQIEGIRVVYVKSVQNYLWRSNLELKQALEEIQPDVILWNLGLTSFLHQRCVPKGSARLIGIFTSPIYSFKQLVKIGFRKLARGVNLAGIHIIGSLIPMVLLRASSIHRELDGLVFQTSDTLHQLERVFMSPPSSKVIPPGVDDIWLETDNQAGDMARRELGISQGSKVIAYFGSPVGLRGTTRLVQAFELAIHEVPDLYLLFLSRIRQGGGVDSARLANMIHQSPSADRIMVIDGFLAPQKLVAYIQAANVVALPFELVPSDAPLSLLETAALGKPLVTTQTACLPELAAHTRNFVAKANDTNSLGESLVRAIHQCQKQGGVEGKRFSRNWRDVGADWQDFLEGR